ncbi:MAG: hypothetical protein JXX14_16575, partial [Deltaproteobacteria bacterium]|nr:hypothetical protein [Deltaproteobacteria bacterium]
MVVRVRARLAVMAVPPLVLVVKTTVLRLSDWVAEVVVAPMSDQWVWVVASEARWLRVAVVVAVALRVP